ncbi:MAG: class I SAM-dependent methyltransferase, partial [Aliivibrio sp.]|nr:class I SAM-dependent methyltransferase [Aliivibrio sp.]
AENTQATITAVDNEEFALDALMQKMKAKGLDNRISTLCANMTNLPCEPASFDLIWSEGSAYIMGVEAALKSWKPLLKEEGVLVLSDAVWSVESPRKETLAFWQHEYPDMATAAARIKQAEAAGYELIDTFSLSDQAWQAYYFPLEARLNELKEELYGSPVLDDLERELAVFHQRKDEFDYQMFIFKNSKIG